MPLEKLDKKHFAKGSRGSEQNGVAAAAPQGASNLKEIALMEAKVIKLCDSLEEVSICRTTVYSLMVSVHIQDFCNYPIYYLL